MKRFLVLFILLLYIPITADSQLTEIVSFKWIMQGKEVASLNNVTYSDFINYTIVSITNSSMLSIWLDSYNINDTLCIERFFTCSFFAVYMFSINVSEKYFNIKIRNNDSDVAIVYLDMYNGFNVTIVTKYENRTIYTTITEIETVYKDKYIITSEQALAIAIGGVCIAAVYFHSKINKGRRLKEISLDELWDEIQGRRRR